MGCALSSEKQSRLKEDRQRLISNVESNCKDNTNNTSTVCTRQESMQEISLNIQDKIFKLIKGYVLKHSFKSSFEFFPNDVTNIILLYCNPDEFNTITWQFSNLFASQIQSPKYRGEFHNLLDFKLLDFKLEIIANCTKVQSSDYSSFEFFLKFDELPSNISYIKMNYAFRGGDVGPPHFLYPADNILIANKSACGQGGRDPRFQRLMGYKNVVDDQISDKNETLERIEILIDPLLIRYNDGNSDWKKSVIIQRNFIFEFDVDWKFCKTDAFQNNCFYLTKCHHSQMNFDCIFLPRNIKKLKIKVNLKDESGVHQNEINITISSGGGRYILKYKKKRSRKIVHWVCKMKILTVWNCNDEEITSDLWSKYNIY